MNFQKIFWTGFLFLGILSFSFGQDQTFFSRELKALGTKDRDKKQVEFYVGLKALQRKYSNHLDTSCNDKAKLYRNLGIHFYNNNDTKKALEFIQDTALQIALNCPLIEDQIITQIYLNIMDSKIILDKRQEALPIIDKLKWHLEQKRAGSIFHQAKIQCHIARCYEELGDFDQALLWIRNSIANYNKLSPSEKKLEAYLEWGYIQIARSDFHHAIQLFETAKLLARDLELHELDKYNADVNYNIAVCHEEIGNYDQALYYTEWYASLTDPNDLIVRADIANLKAYVYLDEGKFQKSLEELNKSIQLSIESKDEYQLSNLTRDYIFRSDILFEDKQYIKAGKAALEALQRTIVRQEPLTKEAIIDFSKLFVKDPNGFNKAAFSYFKAILKTETAENIISFADQLDSTFFSLQTYFSGDESKSVVTSRHHDFCDQLLQYIFSNNLQNRYPDLTSYYISTSKSLSLFEKLSIKEGLSEELKTEYDALNKQWHDIASALEVQESLGNNKSIDSLAQLNFDLSLSRDKLNERLAELNLIPNFRQLRSNLIDQVQSELTAGTALVDFFYGKEYIYSWMAEGDEFQFHYSKTHSLLADDFLSTFNSTATANLALYDQKVDSLSGYFQPFFPLFKKEVQQLTIIPDGKLLYFPFEALQINNKALIQQTSLHYLFSYSINAFERPAKNSQIKPYAGFAMRYGDQLLKNIRTSEEIFKLYQDSFTLSALPFAVEEIKLAKEMFAGTSFLDEHCTSTSFFEEAENYQILHIANHALLNESNSYLSSIVFANEQQPDLVNVIDLKKLNLNAELAILSSCNSGRGELVNGSGLRSLGLSFAEAGCPAILVNLWEAADKSTKQIIEGFAINLKAGMSKSMALQKAKIDYLKAVPRELQHPKYWANMVLIGDDSPIELIKSTPNNWWYWGIGLGVILLIGMVIRRFR